MTAPPTLTAQVRREVEPFALPIPRCVVTEFPDAPPRMVVNWQGWLGAACILGLFVIGGLLT